MMQFIRYYEHPIKHRYYQIFLDPDLFDDWCLVCVWGRLGTNLGGHQKYVLVDEISTYQWLRHLEQRRYRRGYQLIDQTELMGLHSIRNH